MTETIEQTASASTAGDGGAATPSKNKPLSSMLLPELRQVAAGMGLATANQKKSELVAAIRAARSGSSAGSAAATTAPAGGNAPSGARPSEHPTDAPVAHAVTGSGDGSGAAGPAQSRGRAGGAQEGGDAHSGQGSTGESGTGQAGGREGRAGDERAGDERGDQGARSNDGERSGEQHNRQRDRRSGNEGRADRGDGQRAKNQNDSKNQNDGNSQNKQNSGQRDQQNKNTQQGGNSNSNSNSDDDRGGRRGRRYRDRRGRNRDRSSGGDQEPTVSEDDVLIPVAGILDTIEDKNTWFIRTSGYYASPDDVYVANSFVRRFGLRRGDAVTGSIRQAREGERREKYNPLVRLDTVNGLDPEQAKNRVEFTKLTPLYPQERLRLETEASILTTRVIDLVMPIGKGQRALIVSPPKAGKTSIMQAIANAISVNNPEVHLMVVLVDERPEEVTDMQRSVKGEVIASTFDRRPQDHTMVAELSIERAKRLVEMGMDVVVLLDSITRLGRAYNLAAPASGRILSGGVDSTALYPPKRFLGAARNIEHGGSLTIIASALVETGSAGDTVIFEEFKGTGNAELRLDRKIADKRVFPAVDVDQSSTRKEELLLSPDELAVTIKLRRVLHALDPQQAIDLLLGRLRKTRTNYEFLMQIAKTTPGQE